MNQAVAAQPTPFGPLAQRPSGLFVPVNLAEAKVAGDKADGPARDEDGRRRVVLTKADQKLIDRAIKIMHRAGMGIVVGCKAGCGQPMLNEDQGTPNAGYGCKCSRIHFVR